MLTFFWDPLDKWMPDFSSLEEVYGAPFGKRAPVTQSSENTQRAAPIRKSEEAVARHKGLLDSLSRSLPISMEEPNFKVDLPEVRAPTQSTTRVEHFTPNFSYGPPQFDQGQLNAQIQRILKLVEQNKTGYETSSSSDMLLYIFTGVLFLFTFDSFVTLGRQMH